MELKHLTAVIEKSSDGGYGIYIPELEGLSLFGYGETEEEAKEDLKDNLEMFIEHYQEENKPIPTELNNGNVEFEYKYDISGFFKSFSFFNVSELAKLLNINQSLLRQYKQGLTPASQEQKKKIEKGIHEIAEQLKAIRF